MPSFTNPDDNIARLHLTGTEHVVVFGSGAGGHSFAAMKALKGQGKVTAVDVRSEMSAKLTADAQKLQYSGFQAKTGNYEAVGGTGLLNSSADVVVAPNTLFSAGKKDTLLTEAFRVLKPEGTLLIVDWTESFGGMGPQPENIVSENQAKELAEKAGFTSISSFSAGAQHYGLIFSKMQKNSR